MTEHKIQYTAHQAIQRLGALANKAQAIRNAVPAQMKSGDIRHICLSGIQTNVTPLMLAYGLLEFANQQVENIQLHQFCGMKQANNEELLDWFDASAKASLLVFTQYRIENLFLSLLLTFDPAYRERRFNRIVSDLLTRLGLPDAADAQNALKVVALLRNSFHNNGINRNGNFEYDVGGHRFVFVDGRPTAATVFDIMLLIDACLDIVERVGQHGMVLQLQAPISEKFAIDRQDP